MAILGLRDKLRVDEQNRLSAKVPSSYKTVREHRPFFPTVLCLVSSFPTISNLPLLSHMMMFGSWILLSGIALISSAVAQPINSPPTTPTLFEVVVGSLEGNTTYTPPYIVSQVPTAQPNPHTNAVPFRRAQSPGMWYRSSSHARTTP